MLIQTTISLTGVIALLLALSPQARRRRWAPYVALPGQPFWLYATCSWTTWGMFVCSLLYTGVWLHAAWVQWPWRRA